MALLIEFTRSQRMSGISLSLLASWAAGESCNSSVVSTDEVAPVDGAELRLKCGALMLWVPCSCVRPLICMTNLLRTSHCRSERTDQRRRPPGNGTVILSLDRNPNRSDDAPTAFGAADPLGRYSPSQMASHRNVSG